MKVVCLEVRKLFIELILIMTTLYGKVSLYVMGDVDSLVDYFTKEGFVPP